MRAQVDIRPWLENLFPGLSWEQAVAVLASVWLIFMAALAIALSGIAGGQASAAGRPVVVRVPPRPGTATKAPPAPAAVASAGGGAPGFGATDDSSSGGGGDVSGATSAAIPAGPDALPAATLPPWARARIRSGGPSFGPMR